MMSTAIALQNIEPVHRALKLIDAQSRSRGEAYFNSGRVADLEALESAGEFSAKVRGTQAYDVWIRVGPDACTAKCSCPIGVNCKHIYAVLKTLIVEYTAAQVQRLSATQKTPDPPKKTGKGAAEKQVPFPQQVARSLGRALNKEEREFMDGLSHLYQNYGTRAAMPAWQLRNIDIFLPGDFEQTLHLPPVRNRTLRQFWLHLAHGIEKKNGVIPGFMAGVTNLDEVADELREFERMEQIRRWQTALLHAPTARSAATAMPIELRAMVQPDQLVLQVKLRDTFEEPRPMQLREVQRQISEGEAEIAPEAEWLWQAFEKQIRLVQRPALQFTAVDERRAISRLLRMAALRPFVVRADGTPMQFPDAALRWRMEPPRTVDGDYQIELVKEDGAPAPRILCFLPGRPPLYLTNEAVFRGPDAESTPLDPRTANLIPAAALETRNGLTMLHMANIELPRSLKSRVEYIPIKLRVVCKLMPVYFGSTSETCQIRMSSITPDGKEYQTWSGTRWEQQVHAPAQRKGEPITIFDASAIPNPASLIAPMNPKWHSYEGNYSVRVSKKFPEVFVPWIKSLPPGVELELHGELGSLLHAPVAGEVRLDVTETEIDWFDLRVVLNVADTTLTEQELRLLLNARGGYVRLKDKGWRKLEFKLSEEENEQLARLGLSPGQFSGEPQRLHALQLADKAAKRFLKEEQYERIERRAAELKTRVSPELPPTVKAELRPYQLEGYHFLAYLAENRFGGILADDMGLGKTIQTLTWLEWLRAKPGAGRKGKGTSLVICPKSVMDNWRAEAERFVPGLKVKIWHGEELPGMLDRIGEFDLHVLNYNQLRMLGESLASVEFLALILDEGQYIKNPSSISAQVARSLRAQHRLVLSGTPIENRLLDLWSLMAFAMPGVLGSRNQFTKLYDAKEDTLARRRLSARVRPFLLRRTKSQVAKDLPDRTEEDLFCELEGEQKTLYRAELKRAQQILLRLKTQKQLAQERFHVLTSLLRMRQICCHPKLVNGQSKATSAKVEALMDQLEPLMDEGHKVLVFSQFVQMLDILHEEIKPRGWRTFYLAGDTENRGELVRDFQSTEGAAVFLISLKAGGFGLNLTAASYVVLFDPWWNPAVENQAIDRTHRIGQERNVMAYRLLIKDSVEEKIRALQKTKSSLAEDVLGEEKFSQALTLEDLHFIFSDSPASE